MQATEDVMSRRNSKRVEFDPDSKEQRPLLGALNIKRHPRTSDRCRATHDVPYSLRCVLDRFHVQGELSVHEDKDGRTWEVE